jgi:hypothetical protein
VQKDELNKTKIKSNDKKALRFSESTSPNQSKHSPVLVNTFDKQLNPMHVQQIHPLYKRQYISNLVQKI